MSVSVYWRVVEPRKGVYLDSATSSTLEVLCRAFGRIDGGAIVIHESDAQTLRGMALAADFGARAFHDLAEAVATHGKIEVWGEW